MVQDITGITVCYNTKGFMEIAYNSIRKFHPDMPILIINGSDLNNPCTLYLYSIMSKNTEIVMMGYNIGHGRGLDFGINRVKTKYAMLFDTDIKMLKSPVNEMLGLMDDNSFGVGKIIKIGYDGIDCGKRSYHKTEGCLLYLHPFFQIINIANYKKYHRYVHHGAPCYLTMIDIHKKKLSKKILKEFPNLKSYIKHYSKGTRNYRRSVGLKQIVGQWEVK
ncbi:MAG: glycosyltransferase [Candidatus Helarchaeota archaeon]